MEVRGRYFEDILLRVLAHIRVSTKSELLECVGQTVAAPNSLIRRCACSPFQIAVGGDGGFLQDQLDSSSILHDDLAAHTGRIRSTARLAVLQIDDDVAIRRLWTRDLAHFVHSQWATMWQSGCVGLAMGVSEQTEFGGGDQESSWRCSGQLCGHAWECHQGSA